MKTVSASRQATGSDTSANAARRLALMGSVASCICLPAMLASEPVLPSGGAVVAGDVAIGQPQNGAMIVTQGSQSGVVNWDSFSIGQGGHVDIRQPGADAVMLNRVTGSTTSGIHGQLTANGQVHLVNPNGIFIGPTGTVNSGGFVASTLAISNEDFLASRYRYKGDGASATVTNAGRLTIGREGYAALLGGRVRNSGVVTVPMGRIGFGSGEMITLDFSGDQFLQVALPTGGEDDGEALIENSGIASAQAGLIEMRASTARNAVRHAINMSGVTEASSVSVQNGVIVLGGGAGGTVAVSGRVSAENQATILTESKRPPTLPKITIEGQRIVLAGADIDASGVDGGGDIRIGGDFAGAGDMLRADFVTVDDATQIHADALGSGDGGRIAIWSDHRTEFAGKLSARGGDAGGDGGFLEVSSKETLAYSGLADTRAKRGDWGQLLLDPTDITVNSGSSGPNSEDTIESNLGTTSVTLNTASGASDSGNITINADIDWSAATEFALIADANINLNGDINGPAGTFTLDAASLINNPNAVNVDEFVLRNGTWVQTGSALPDFDANNFVLVSGSAFFRSVGGDGSPGDPFQITDVFGLQGIGSSGMIGMNTVLVNDIDASGTSGWSGPHGSGFAPISTLMSTLDGGGFTVSDLTIAPIDDGEPEQAGFIHTIDGSGTLSNLTLEDVDVTGSDAGGAAVENRGNIRNVMVSGQVTSSDGNAGGMVASNTGLIQDSASSADVMASVTTSASRHIGGFVGFQDGTVNRSHAIGSVTVTNSDGMGNISVGGFAGRDVSADTINDSYSLGAVSVTSNAGAGVTIFGGGFVGRTDGAINRSFSAGALGISGDATVFQGGFAGQDSSSGGLSGNFWDITASGQGTSAGGTGLTTSQFQDTETFLSLGTSAGWNFGSVWAPGDTGFYPVNYSTSPVILAEPGAVTVQYGLTPSASTSGTITGGPDDFLLDEPGDTLDTSPVFNSLTFADRNVGTTTFRVDSSDLTSANGVTYRVIDRVGDATITAAPLTVTANDVNKTYGQTATLGGFSLSTPLFFSDTITSVSQSSAGASATATVAGGPYVINNHGATGSGLNNYDITLENGSLTVIPAPLTVTPNDISKTYGQTATLGGFTVTGTLFGSDSVDSVSQSSDGIAAQSDAGTYSIYNLGVSGSGLDNYDVTQADGTLTVLQAPLTITADDQVKTFGTEFSFDGTEFTASGLLFPEDSVDFVSLSSIGAQSNASSAGNPFAILGTSASGSGIENYDVTFVDGYLTVEGGEGEIPVPRPPTFVEAPLPNPGDLIGLGDTLSGGGLSSIALSSSPEVAEAQETLGNVRGLGDDLVIKADSCKQGSSNVGRYLACLSDALNDFSSELDEISSDLPPEMQNVAQIIQTARRDVNAAQARAERRLAAATTEAERQAIRQDAVNEARGALETASNEIRKAISLVRVEDPELARVHRATISTAADAVDTASIQLSRVVEL